MLDIFQYPDITFPDGFLWGAATAGAQIEGNNNSFHDNPDTAPSFAYGGLPYEPAGKACNSFEQYNDDIELLKKMNLGLYRMSVEWSRIEPIEGKFDQNAINHYLEVLKRLKEASINVCLTIHHLSHPVWFHERGAFNSLDNMSPWISYIETIVPKYKLYVDYWIVINEMNLPFIYSIEERMNMLQYHANGYHTIKKFCDTPVSSSLSYSIKVPLRGYHDVPDKTLADYVDYIENEFFIHAIKTGEIVFPFQDVVFMPELKGTCDFWALNTYVRQLVNSRKKEFRFDQYTASRFDALPVPFFTEEIAPEIMVQMLMRFNDRPILISENGIAVSDDRVRIVYISAMVQAIKQGIDLGADVIGYLHWSLMDNWEWGTNLPTFGLVEVNRETFDRTIKPSGFFYADIAKKNSFNQKILQSHLTELPSRINYTQR